MALFLGSHCFSNYGLLGGAYYKKGLQVPKVLLICVIFTTLPLESDTSNAVTMLKTFLLVEFYHSLVYLTLEEHFPLCYFPKLSLLILY